MNSQHYPRDLIGIVGGMGPLASSAFLSTLYDGTQWDVEQDAGRYILYSDPSIPDRSEAFLGHRDEIVLAPFVEILHALKCLHVTKIVVCCITLHYLFPCLSTDLRELVISLIDVIFAALEETREHHLLLCTNATLQLRIFQNHQLWERYSDYILLPRESDQQTIHALIYHLKSGGDIRIATEAIQELLDKYHTGSFIAGCTEFHLLSQCSATITDQRPAYRCIDPLTIIANGLAKAH
ncbi:aspartate/glutamate racemase family protein [Dictyobacter arantiisoli]|uniref:Aspartate racemase n=1 Tax=Dictyobacter arantiisoli TaxID=2014874 RepID=A0A5A5TFE2_9CHLR|nr:aspartate/glutamate racemase family protein [Dictyobacter arantiisoli]GCF09958.1 aspartate racemase [Dictyobacter arantiisoli]